MTTKDDKAPVRADDDGPELAAIASDVRPAVDAGKGRALAFGVVAAMIGIFVGPPLTAAPSAWLAERIAALASWYRRALDVESGEEQKREIGQRLTLLDVAGIADRIASAALCQARAGLPVPFDRWVVFDIATALRRACGCSAWPINVVQLAGMVAAGKSATKCEQEDADRMQNGHDATTNTLLPLLIRDARRLCAAAKVDASPIEAAIARHGGRPS